MRTEINDSGVVSTNVSGSSTLVFTVSNISYTGGTIVSSAAKFTNFTASYTESTSYALQSASMRITLSSTDPVGTRYEFWDRTGNAAVLSHLLSPNGSKSINGVSGTFGINRNYGCQTVEKGIDGNWYAAV